MNQTALLLVVPAVEDIYNSSDVFTNSSTSVFDHYYRDIPSYRGIIIAVMSATAVLLAALSVLVTLRLIVIARRRRLNNERMRQEAPFSEEDGIGRPVSSGGEGEDRGATNASQPSSRITRQQRAPKPLPAIVLQPDLSTVELAIREENSNQTSSSAAAASTTTPSPPAVFHYPYQNSRGGFNRRQQRVRQTALPPELVTVEVDGSAPPEQEEEIVEEEEIPTAAPSSS